MIAEECYVKLEPWDKLKSMYGTTKNEHRETVIDIGCQLLDVEKHSRYKNKVGKVLMIDDHHPDYEGVVVIFKDNPELEVWFDEDTLKRVKQFAII